MIALTLSIAVLITWLLRDSLPIPALFGILLSVAAYPVFLLVSPLLAITWLCSSFVFCWTFVTPQVRYRVGYVVA